VKRSPDGWLPAWCAIVAGLSGFLYAVSFILLPNISPRLSAVLSATFLLALGFFATGAFVGLHRRLRSAGPHAGTWALVLLMAGAFGAVTHGGYDLANQLHPPSALNTDLASQVDPRGLLTFAVTGLGLIVASSLMIRSEQSNGLGYLGFLSGILLLVLYLGRLIVLEPSSPVILIPALINGFILGPAWYLWLGIRLAGPHVVMQGEP
jgi:hypothetical protein